MARDWANHGRGKLGCSYKRTTLVVCCLNIVVALYVLHSIYGSLYLYSNDSHHVAKYSSDQIRRMEESIRIRKAAEPIQLLELVNNLKKHLYSEGTVEFPQTLKQKVADEILNRLRDLNGEGNVTVQRETIESWRQEKLREAEQLTTGSMTVNSSSIFLPEEAELLQKALGSNWPILLEDIGLWIPSEVVHQEHDDKPEGVEEPEEEILAGRLPPPECHAELHTDYDGAAVRWGLTHHKESAADCCQACLDHAKNAKPGEKRCNIWVYCPSVTGCYSPDIYEHRHQECWLKYAEQPKLNFKETYSESYRNSHPGAPLIVPWVSGVVRL